MQFSTAPAPHFQSKNSITRIMGLVLMALIPAIFVKMALLGSAILIQISLAMISALIAEASILALRKQAIIPRLMDLSAMTTAVLLALCLPVLAPYWLSITGTVFAIIIAKQLYGGLGYNPFNPAMVGYAFLLISYPQPMIAWLNPALETLSFKQQWQAIFYSVQLDGITMATPLDQFKTQLRLDRMDIHPLLPLAYLIGGLGLIYKKVITWHIPLSLITSLTLISSIFYSLDSQQYAAPLFHLFNGAIFIGAFFIATDPVTAATSVKGRLVYGAIIGCLIYIIRVWGAYPDAIAFAVLIANMIVPTLDYYTKPRVFGH